MVVWGQTLVSVALSDQRAVPLFLEKCFKHVLENWIDVEGIFRISGKESEIKELISMIDAIGDITIKNDTSPFTICNIITRFIRDIHQHILLDKNAQAFKKCTTAEQIKSIFNTLPIINKVVFSRFIGFLTLIAKHSDNNRMTLDNIAIILTPMLVDEPQDPQFILPKDVCLLMLKEYNTICEEVPALDSNGNWLSEEAFSKSIESVVSTFLCQSSFMTRQLTPVKVVKQARMVRNVRIDVGGWDSMMNELLAINPPTYQTNVIPLSKL